METTDTKIADLIKQLEKLQKEVNLLKVRRVGQTEILVDAVKMRHIGEGVRFIRDGITADIPVSAEVPMQGAAIYYDRTAKKLYIWNNDNDEWDEVALS